MMAINHRCLLRTVAITCVILIIIAIYTSLTNPHSPVNLRVAEQRAQHHDALLATSSEFVSSWTKQGSAPICSTSATPEIALIVMTGIRSVSYLLTWFTSIAAKNSPAALNRVGLYMINTDDSRSALHIDPFRSVPGVHIIEQEHNMENSVESVYLLGQYRGYMLSLQACIDSQAKACVVFEDDALLTTGFIDKVDEIIAQVPSSEREKFVVKLWSSTQFGGWGLSISGLFELILPTQLVAMIIAIFIALAMHRRGRRLEEECEPLLPDAASHMYQQQRVRLSSAIHVFIVVFVIIWGTLVLCALIVTKQTLTNAYDRIQHGSSQHLHGGASCTGNVAILFSPAAARSFITYLKTFEQLLRDNPNLDVIPIDILLIIYWAVDDRIPLYTTTPALAQHIGAVSSNPTRLAKNFQSIATDETFIE